MVTITTKKRCKSWPKHSIIRGLKEVIIPLCSTLGWPYWTTVHTIGKLREGPKIGRRATKLMVCPVRSS